MDEPAHLVYYRLNTLSSTTSVESREFTDIRLSFLRLLGRLTYFDSRILLLELIDLYTCSLFLLSSFLNLLWVSTDLP